MAVSEDGSVEEVANTWDIESSENPDGFILESHPYGLAVGPDGLLWVADAGANTVLTVDPESGEVSLVATLGGVPSPLPNPTRGDAMEMDPVPTGIVPTETFEDSYTLEVGDQVLELTYYGANHSHGNTFIYAPAQKVLMVVDVVFPGWSPFRHLAVSEDVSGYLAAHDQILEYDFDLYIGGHLARYGTREDVELQQAYFMDMTANALTALQTTNFNAIAAETGFENPWLLFGTYLDTVAQTCADLTIEQWGDVLGGVDINSAGHCDRIIESLRVD